VRYSFAKSGSWNWEIIFYEHYRSIFNHCDIIGLIIVVAWKSIEFGKKTQNKGYYGVQGYSRSSRSVPIESPYEELQANIGWKSTISLQRGPVDPKFQVEVAAPTKHSSSKKTRINDISYDIKSGQIFLPFCHNSRVWRTDRRTDNFLIARPRLYRMQLGKNHGNL